MIVVDLELVVDLGLCGCLVSMSDMSVEIGVLVDLDGARSVEFAQKQSQDGSAKIR